MKKVLIWNDYPLGPVGGPSGYLYNLKIYLDENNIENIVFYNNDIFEKKIEIKKKKKFEKIREIIRKIKKIVFRKKELKKRIKKFYKLYDKKIDLNEYDIIHFHDTKSLFRAQNLLKNFKGKVLLTSHCPKTPAAEEIEDNIKMEYKKYPKKLREFLENVDRFSFSRADFLVFPCKDAQEPYEEDIELKKIIENKEKDGKILYVETGIPLKNIEKDSDFFNDKGIKKDRFIVSYIGRHNDVKGYDFLLKLGQQVLKKYSDVTFVIGGEINENMPPLDNSNWIEYGWTSKGYSIIKNSNLFVLPNKKTYFDLILLEVLSMGTPVLLSNTGGNRYFKKYKESGLYYFEKENLDEALSEFDKIYTKWKENKLEEDIEKNEKIFRENFTVDIFSKKYIKLYNGVLNGKIK